MKKQLEKGKRILALGMASIIALSGMSVASQAANRTDKTFKFDFSDSQYDRCAWRQKTDKSKTYVKVNYSKYSSEVVKAWVQGKKQSGSDTINCSGGYYYNINKKGAYWMTNYVRNNGCNYARLGAKLERNAKNVIEGVWSPDSGK